MRDVDFPPLHYGRIIFRRFVTCGGTAIRVLLVATAQAKQRLQANDGTPQRVCRHGIYPP